MKTLLSTLSLGLLISIPGVFAQVEPGCPADCDADPMDCQKCADEMACWADKGNGVNCMAGSIAYCLAGCNVDPRFDCNDEQSVKDFCGVQAAQ